MDKIKNFFKSFNLFETLFLLISLITVVTISIIYKSSAFTIIYSIIAITSVVLLSKASIIAPLLMVVSYTMYSILSYMNGLYGETILNVCLVFVQIGTFINWFLKKKQQEKTKTIVVKKVSWIEWLIVGSITCVIGVGCYFMLRALNTKYLELSTLLMAVVILANYFTFRKSAFTFVFFLISNILGALIWILPVLQGEPGGEQLIVMALNYLVYVINNTYGLYNWIKIRKKEERMKSNTEI